MKHERTDQSAVQKLLGDLYDKYKTLQDGEVATHIPELGKADPNSLWNTNCNR